MSDGDIKSYDIVYNGLTLQINVIDLGGGQVEFDVTCKTGSCDLNAIYWNDGVADGSSYSLNKSLNMDGSKVDWDGAIKLSDPGLGPDGVNKATYLTAGEHFTFTTALTGGVTFANLDDIGVRATSTSTAEGSIKGVDGTPELIVAPKLSISDAACVDEGGNATFTISLDHSYPYDVYVTYTTHSGTATEGSDYTGKTETVKIPAGSTSLDITIATIDDTTYESGGHEHFTVTLSDAHSDIPGPDLAVAIADGSGEGCLMDNDLPPVTNSPPDAVNDTPACGVEGLVPISGNVLANDTDPDNDSLTVTAVNGISLSTLTADANGWYSLILTDGTLKIKSDGSFSFTYSGAGLPVDGDWNGSFNYTISDGHDHTDTATVSLCIDGAAASPGYWAQHDGSGPQANDWNIAQNTSFETYFNVQGPYAGGVWDVSSPVNGASGTVADITFRDALDIPNGGGGENLLAREAVTAVLNFLDEDTHDAFVTAYENWRGIDFDDASNDQAVLDDLKMLVKGALDHTGPETIAELNAFLQHTHE